MWQATPRLAPARRAASIVPPVITRKPSTIASDHGSSSCAMSSSLSVPARRPFRYSGVCTSRRSTQLAGCASTMSSARMIPESISRRRTSSYLRVGNTCGPMSIAYRAEWTTVFGVTALERAAGNAASSGWRGAEDVVDQPGAADPQRTGHAHRTLDRAYRLHVRGVDDFEILEPDVFRSRHLLCRSRHDRRNIADAAANLPVRLPKGAIERRGERAAAPVEVVVPGADREAVGSPNRRDGHDL